VHATPRTQARANPHPATALQRHARHLGPLDATAVAGPLREAVEERADEQRRARGRGRLGQDEVVDGAGGVRGDVGADGGGVGHVVVGGLSWLAVGVGGDFGGAEEGGARDLDPVAWAWVLVEVFGEDGDRMGWAGPTGLVCGAAAETSSNGLGAGEVVGAGEVYVVGWISE
jgi:hypothetical protein